MNEKNFEYLKDQIKFTGFGEGLEKDLKEKMQKQSPEFQLYHLTKFGKDESAATLYFKKSDQSDMYFFNKYELSLKKEDSPGVMKQTFYVGKENTFTLKEAFNLMNGRAVNKDLTSKEGQRYNTWVQMDFKQTDKNGNYRLRYFHENYGFDLSRELTKLPIKELGNQEEKNRLIESLKKGNRQAVTFHVNNNGERHFIEANPQFKTINIYDGHMQRLTNKRSQENKQSETESNGLKRGMKKEGKEQASDDEGSDVPNTAQKRKKRKTQAVS